MTNNYCFDGFTFKQKSLLEDLECLLIFICLRNGFKMDVKHLKTQNVSAIVL